MRKAQATAKVGAKHKKEAKESERQMHRMRKELIELKDANRQLNNRCQDLQSNAQRMSNAPRVQSAHPSSQQNPQ